MGESRHGVVGLGVRLAGADEERNPSGSDLRLEREAPGEIDQVGDAALLHVGEEIGLRGEAVGQLRGADLADGWELPLGALMVEQCHAKLLQIALTRRASGRLTGCLHGGEQEPDEGADDGDDDEQFDQCEAGLGTP